MYNYSNFVLCSTPMSLFKDFDLLSSLQGSFTQKNLVTPTEIQSKAMPILLEGRSVVGVAETGSGKTLAYAFPIFHLLNASNMRASP